MATSALPYQTVRDADSALQRETLVLRHLPQVRLIAKRIHDRLPDYVSLDDLVSTGVIGLLSAIDNFDPSRDVQLNTYAERKIRGAILDSLRETDWAPRTVRQKSRQIEAAIHRAKQLAGREPTEEEIAGQLGIPLLDYQKWLAEVNGVELEPLEYVTGEARTPDLLQFVSSNNDSSPAHILERAELERILVQAIDRMPKTERTVLHLYYYEELNLRSIGEVMGIHLSRAAQLRTQGILRLRSHLERVWLSLPGKKK